MPELADDPTRAWLAGLEAKARGKVPVPIGAGYGYTGWSIAGPFWDSTASDYRVYDDAGKVPYLNSVVLAAINWLARNFPVPDLVVKRYKAGEEEGEPVEDHPTVALLDRPNEVQDFFGFFALAVLSDVSCGLTYWYKRRDVAGKVAELLWLPPWCVKPLPDPTRRRLIAGYEFRQGEVYERYAPEDLVVVRNPDPCDPRGGMSPLAGAWRSIRVVDRWERYDDTLLKNHGAVPWIISPAHPEGEIQPQDVELIRSQYGELQTGENNGKPFVSPRGIKLDRAGFSPKDMALDTMIQPHVASITAALGFSPMVLGLPDPSKTYANLAEANRAAYQNALMPMQGRFAEAINRDPELVAEDERLCWDYSDVEALKESESEKIERLVKAAGGKAIVTRNEARKDLGLEPIDGWDEQDTMPPPEPMAPGRSPDGAGRDEEPVGANGRPDFGLRNSDFGFQFNSAIRNPNSAIGSNPNSAFRNSAPRLAVKARNSRRPEALEMVRAAAGALALPDGTPLDVRAAWEAKALDADETRDVLSALADAGVAHLRDLAASLIEPPTEKAFRDDVARWYAAARKYLRTLYLAAAHAVLGPGPLAATEKAALAERRAFHLEHLNDFRKEVASGKQARDGTLPARAGLYGAAAWGVGLAVERANKRAGGATEARRVLAGDAEHCDECPALAEAGWQPIAQVRPIGETPCMSNCRCFVEYR